MNHSEEALLSAFLDGELEKSERIQIQNHLASCSDCQEELESLRAVKTILARAPRKLASKDWEERWDRIPRRFMPLNAWVPASVAVVAALAIGLWIMGSRWISPRTASISELSLNSVRPAQDIPDESATQLVAPPITGSDNQSQIGAP